MKKLWGVVCLIALVVSVASGAPTIRTEDGVLNASSYAADIAPGSWFVVFGSGLGPASISVYSGDKPFPTELSGTSITFTPAAGGSPISARMWYTLAGQIAGMLPSPTAPGDYDVKVTYNGATSAAYRVKVVERNFGFATQAQNGAGPAQATYGRRDLNRFTTGRIADWDLRPAKLNDTMVLWGTGLGADPKSDTTGETSGDLKDLAGVKVVVGGIEVTPVYAGRSPNSPGLDQINFVVPATVTPGCFVSLAVKAGGRTSNFGTIAVAEEGKDACTHPSFTQAQLARLDQGGTLTIGSLVLSKTTTKMSYMGMDMSSMAESASGSFSKYGVDGVAGANFSMLQTGSCFVFHRTGTLSSISYGIAPVPLDAGAQLTLNGPNASNKAMTRGADKSYNLSLYSSSSLGGTTGTPTLAEGTYTIAGTDGPDVRAFSASVGVPGSFSWTNESALASPIPRSSNMNIAWTGGGSGLVTITGMAMAQSGGTADNPIYDATIFSCVAQASAGSFSVLSSVLTQLPAVSSDILSGNMGFLSVLAVPDPLKGQGVFTAPLTAGGSIDQGYMSYAIGTLKMTSWQ
ncbi:MAG: hypothetical protein LLG20_05645 [Acidobacteriales bacterium]|nr:hypothetical protein [Terriglobales bacterium]